MDLMVSTVTKEVQVDEILPLPVKVEMWAMDLVDALEADYKKKYPNATFIAKPDDAGQGDGIILFIGASALINIMPG